MKRLLLTIALLATVTGAGLWAQAHWSLSHQGEGASTETVVYARLNLGTPSMTPDYTYYEIAAFVDGEVRAIGTCTNNMATGDNNYFLLSVKGNYDQSGSEDNGKTISFKMYNTNLGTEYDLNPQAAVTFTGGSYGSYSSPFALAAVEAEMVMLGDIVMNKGETIDLKTRLTFSPENATMPNNIQWAVGSGAESCLSVTADGLLTALAPGEFLELTFSYGFITPKPCYVTVKSPATAITVKNGYETIYVNTGDEATLTARLHEAISIDPADATDVIHWVSGDESIVYENMTNGNWVPAARGTVTMTAQIWDDLGNPRLQAQLTVKVVEALTGFTFDIPDPLPAGTTQQIVVTLQPSTADIDVNQLTYSVTDSNLPAGWDLLRVASVASDGNGHITYTVDVVHPGNANFRVAYEGLTSDPQPLNAGVPLLLDEGWQWKTLWTDIPSPTMATAFTTDLVEIRSQEAVMANDASYGYFGTLYDNGLVANTAYKVNMSQDVLLNHAYVMLNGSYLNSAMDQQLYRGWTWIGYPYYNSYALDAFDFQATTGDRIVSFADGFAEYDGSNWVGTLTQLSPWSAYLYYNNKEAAGSFQWADEPSFATTHPTLAPRRASPTKTTGVWQYDARRFRDNMSVIAELRDMTAADYHSVGAFVGNECRGEGSVVDGKLFITVHADQGEPVSFKLYDGMTGRYYTLAEQVTMTAKVGSLSEPLTLTVSGEETTAIRVMDNRQPPSAADHCYDLSGRRIQQPRHGVTIVRMADGTWRKVAH